MPQYQKLTTAQLVGKIYQRYPQYRDVDPDVFLPKFLQKYPMYRKHLTDYDEPSGYGVNTLDFNRIETPSELSERNARQMPNAINEEHIRNTSLAGRYFDSVMTGLFPFGMYDSDVAAPTEVSEMIASAAGELTGMVPGFIGMSLATGGVGTIPASARAAQVLNKFRSLSKTATTLQKAGKTVQAEKAMANASNALLKAQKAGLLHGLDDVALASEKIGYGLLGKSNWYKKKILSLASNPANKKNAQLLQLTANNLGAFMAHSQIWAPIETKLEDRMVGLGTAAASSLIFTVAGTPSIYFKSKAAALAVETPALIATGMYSDLGQSDMPIEERIVHGMALATFHNLRKGFDGYRNRQHIKESLKEMFDMPDAQARKIAWSRGMDTLEKAAVDAVNKGGTKHAVYYNRGDPKETPAVDQVQIRKISKGNYKPVFRDLTTGKEQVGFPGVKEKYPNRRAAISAFFIRYSKSKIDLAKRKAIPEKPPEVVDEIIENLGERKKVLKSAEDKERGFEPPQKEETKGARETVSDVHDTVIKDKTVEEVKENTQFNKNKLQQIDTEASEARAEYNRILKTTNKDPKVAKTALDRKLRRITKRRKEHKKNIEDNNKKLADLKPKDEVVHNNPELIGRSGSGAGRMKLMVDKLFNIPFFKGLKEGIDYARAGIGRYVGEFGYSKFDKSSLYETESQVIHRNLVDIVEGNDPANSYKWQWRPVFQVNTNNGTNKAYIVFDGKPSNTFLEGVELAKTENRSKELDTAESRYQSTPDIIRRMTLKQLKAKYKGIPELNTAKKLTPEVQDAVVKHQQKIDMRNIKTAQNNVEMLKKFNVNDFPTLEKGKWKQNQDSLDVESYANWNSADPNVQNPWYTTLTYKNIDPVTGERVPETFEPTEGGQPKRFASKEDAIKWAEDNWVSPEGFSKQLSELDASIDYYKGTDYHNWKRARRDVNSAIKKEKYTNKDTKVMLDGFFPQAKGAVNNLNLEEMRAFAMMIDTRKDFTQYHKNMSEIIPPTIQGNIKLGFRKFWLGTRKLGLPLYTVLGWHKGINGLKIADLLLKSDLLRNDISGEYIAFKKTLRNDYNLSEPEYRKIVSLLDENKFGSFYTSSLDKLDKAGIKQSYEQFMDATLALMQDSGMMIKNGKTGRWERIFDAYDSKGKPIAPDVPHDVMRIVREGGFEYLDNTGKRLMPTDSMKWNRKMSQDLPADEYVREILLPNYDSAWVIRGNNRYIATESKGKIAWRKLGPDRIDVRKNGRLTKNVEIYKRTGKGEFVPADGKPNHHVITGPFVPRVITSDFMKLAKLDGSKENFMQKLAENLAKTDPEYRKMGEEGILLARQDVERQMSYWDENGMYGSQWSRIAELPAMLAYERNIVDGKAVDKLIPIEGNSLLDVGGKIMRVGSDVIDVNGNTRKVSKVVDVYERDFDTAMTKYMSRVAHQVSVHKYFPLEFNAKTGRFESEAGVHTRTAQKLLDGLEKETDFDFRAWAFNAMKMQLNGTTSYKFEPYIAKWTAFSAQIGLSSPLSGAKNLILGQAANVNTFGFRTTMRVWAHMMSGGFRDAKLLAEKLGQTEAGLHDMYTGKGPISRFWTVFNPGLMRPTELFNRYTGVVIGRMALETHIKNLKGIKNPMNRGMSLATSHRTLKDVFKFTKEEIKELLKYKPEDVMDEANPRTEFYRKRAMQQGSLFTQGGPSLPMIPKWMGQRWAKPMTLFYRIAYRVTDAVANTVIKPAIVDGNPFPALRYAMLGTGSGAAMYSMYYYILGEERMNRFRKLPLAYWDMFIRGEGLGVMSNMVDSHGGVVDTYTPVIARNIDSTFRETINIATGKKFPLQGARDWLKENVVLVNHSIEVLERANAPIKNRVQHSKRRQRQFAEHYFADEPYAGDVDSQMTKRSPYYRMLRETFWAESNPVNDDEKARVYFSALQFVTHDLYKKEPALLNQRPLAEKKAKAILASIIRRQRPMPSSWLRPDIGKKSKKKLYFEVLDDPMIVQEETDLDREYRLRFTNWNSAISRGRKKHYRKTWGDTV